MPVMDGYQATKEIRDLIDTYNHENNNDESIEQPCIVALTAYNTDVFRVKCFEAGMNEFLTKPINVEELKVILSRLNLI